MAGFCFMGFCIGTETVRASMAKDGTVNQEIRSIAL